MRSLLVLRRDILAIIFVFTTVTITRIVYPALKSHHAWHNYNPSPEFLSIQVIDITDSTVSTQKIDNNTRFIPENKSFSSKLQKTVTNPSVTSNSSSVNTSISPETKVKDLILNRTQTYRKELIRYGMSLPTQGGVAKRVIIVTTWRSGSSFTAEILGVLPGVFYHYEPLMYKHLHDFQYNETLLEQGINTTLNILNCSYAILQDYLKYFNENNNQLNRIMQFGEICKLVNRSLCYEPDILSFACKKFPLQINKLVRLPLKAFLPFLRKPELNLHVVLLVRDPRGTFTSRKKMSWCKSLCIDPKRLCSLLQKNYETALQAMQEFPDSFTVLRYDDLALNPFNVSTWLFGRLKLPMTPSVGKYIEKHTTANVELPYSTTRILGSRVDLWKKQLPWKDIEAVQNACGNTLTNYGYAPILSSNLLNGTDSVLNEWKFTIPSSENGAPYNCEKQEECKFAQYKKFRKL